jgi:hypothetical protein
MRHKYSEEGEKILREFCERALKNKKALRDEWPNLAGKYDPYLPERVVHVMKEILDSLPPIDLDRAYHHLENFERLQRVAEYLQKDIDIAEKLKNSSNLYFIAIQQSIEDDNFSRYFKIDLCNRMFYLASLKYMEEYAKIIHMDLADLISLQIEAQKKIMSVKDQYQKAGLQKTTKTINSPLPSDDALIAELEEYYCNPVVNLNGEKSIKPQEICTLLKKTESIYREIVNKRIELSEALNAL